MRPGLVSVMMPAYNAAPYVAEAVRSMLAQSYMNWELLVVNDGSTDGTPQIARQFRDSRIRVIDKENGGESSARNVALDHSTGEFIAYLDADDLLLPRHLAVTVGFLLRSTDCGAVYTDGFHIDETGRRLAPLQSRRRGPFEGRLYEQVVRASDVFGPPLCVVLRRRLVVQHGLRYDPRIVIGPDWDFFLRYSDVATFGYLPERTGLYRVHRANITARVDRTRRAGFLAICREKAIGMDSFNSCSTDTRVAVFYDLLINLLRDQPARREAILARDEFSRLPVAEQGRLIRLMATSACLYDRDHGQTGHWLRRASALNPADHRATMLRMLHTVSPSLCVRLLRLRDRRRPRQGEAPFADLDGAPA